MARGPSQSPPILILEDFLPYRLSVLSNRVSHAIATLYADQFDLTIPEWRVMALLGRSPGMTAGEIAEATEMDKVAISRAVTRLESAKRVAVRLDKSDARRRLLELTSKGEAIYAKVAPLALSCEQKLIAALSKEERAALSNLLTLLSEVAKTL